jgi:hypothetical protein
MNEAERREHALAILGRRNRYQFGQPDDHLVLDGAVACTDAAIQMTKLIADGRRVSLNKVRVLSGAPQDQPLTSDEALLALHRLGLPYARVVGETAGRLLDIARRRGPVIICERYWSHPQWKGYTYGGITLTGKARNDNGRIVRPGFADPIGRAGLTQPTFRDGHAVLLACDDRRDGRRVAIVRDSNHNTPARPERPAYDVVSVPQLRRMLGSWPGSSLALVPTRAI